MFRLSLHVLWVALAVVLLAWNRADPFWFPVNVAWLFCATFNLGTYVGTRAALEEAE